MFVMRSSEGLDDRRKRALWRAWRRGTREMDIMFGLFANAEIERFSEAELGEFEDLLAEQDTDLQKWFMGQVPVPQAFATPLFARIIAFRAANPIG
ncbi:MAG: succinate dehydrogenase assembly factor 2 [Rhizobiaceae bacterium]|jgi:antitoxin CptB|nr:succinate dehydrogenase assembly factor 2 [Rhizobiaceae bacterium]